MSSTGLVLTLPILFTIALVIRLVNGSPILFVQDRAGIHGVPFKIKKFRTMSFSYTSDNKLLPDEHRITKLGKFLRSTSLDELPELWNVLLGEMSLVGPRPLLIEYLPKYTPLQARRLEVLPGITGFAQVNGRNSLGWDEKFKLDVWYVDNKCFSLDLSILCKTIKFTIMRKGISHKDSSTMPPFSIDN